MKIFAATEELKTGLDYHLERQNVLTANLAHVDTPGYKPLDLERRATFNRALDVAMEATNPAHFGSLKVNGPKEKSFKVITDKGASPGLDGNSVSLDRESVKLAANNIRYETVATLVQDELRGLEWAANDGRGA